MRAVADGELGGDIDFFWSLTSCSFAGTVDK